MKLVRARQARRGTVAACDRAGAARQRVRRRDAGAGLPRQEDLAEGGAAGSARGRRARQHLCLRGAAPRAALAEARASTIATRTGAPNDHATRLVDGIRLVLNDAIKAGGSSLRDHRLTDGALGMFQHNFRVYDREGERVPDAGLQGHDQAHRAERAVDVFLSGVSEVTTPSRPPRPTGWCAISPAPLEAAETRLRRARSR